MDRITKVFTKIENIVLFLGNISILLMMGLITVDAVLRYTINSPLPGVYEFVSIYLMVAVVYLGMSYTLRQGGHIKVDLLERRMPQKLKGYLNFIKNIISLIVFVIIFYESWLMTFHAYIDKDYFTGIISYPMFISYGLVTLGSLMFVIRVLLESLSKLSVITQLTKVKEQSKSQ